MKPFGGLTSLLTGIQRAPSVFIEWIVVGLA